MSNLNKDLESFEKIPYNLTNKQQKEINKNKIEYFNKFKNKNYSLEQIDSFLSNNFSEYKNISSNFKDMLIKDANDYSNTKNSKNVVKNLKSKSNKVVSINELEKQIKYLTDAKVAFATMAAVAAVSSAISWAFLLVPSAIALSVASIACRVVVSALDIALVSLGEQRNAALLTGSLTLDIVKIGFAKASICYKLLVSSIATVTSVSWVLPALVALISLGSLIITIIYAYVL